MHSEKKLENRILKTRLRYEDYCVRDHRVHGTRILPGVFLLDLIYRMTERQNVPRQSVELRRVVFYQPIALSEDFDREIRISMEQVSNHWVTTVNSRNIQHVPVDGEWAENCTAEIHLLASTPLELRDPAEWSVCFNSKTDIEELYAHVRSQHIDHYDFMKIRGTVFREPDCLLADARLSDLAKDYLPSFCIHPAYLDFATILPFAVLRYQGKTIGDQPFIPIFIDRFRIYGTPGDRCFMRVNDQDVSQISGEMIRASFTIFSPEGRVLAAFDGFSAKRIRKDHLISRLVTAPIVVPAPRPESESVAPEIDLAQSATSSLEEIARATVRTLVAKRKGMESSGLDEDKPFYEHGLESVDLLRIVKEIEALLGAELYPTLLFEYTTIRELATYLGEQFPEKFKPEMEEKAVPPPIPTKSISIELSPPISRVTSEEPIVIIGVAGRYPMAQDLDEFWENLCEGRDCIINVPKSRWDVERYFSPERGLPGKTYSRWGGYIDGHDQFDSLFFNISPNEAVMMDPHERIFLETVWATLENAGYTRERLRKVAPAAGKGANVGVFAGVMWSDYQLFGWESYQHGATAMASSWFSSVANRVSYFFNLTGPSMPVDTACSSSLYAIHLACESIRRGECRMAIAGGVNLSLHPYKYIRLSELQMLSSTGRCRTFGADGDGYVPGEGVGAVLLKPITDALRDGDTIYAVIKGSAVNHNGRTSGFSVPSPESQERLIAEALKHAGVASRSISLIEAHGTGTALGDPIEVSALTAAFGRYTSDQCFCSLGSVKSNIGHLEAAAGIAGLTKVLLCMRRRMLVPSLHSSRLNPNLALETTPFRVQQAAAPWEQPVIREGGVEKPVPRRAGISSFGAGGTNVHLIVEEYVTDVTARPVESGPEIVVLSAKNDERLREYAKRLRRFLEQPGVPELRDLAYTLQTGREGMTARLAIVASHVKEAREALEAYLDGRKAPVFLTMGRSSISGDFVANSEHVLELVKNGELSRIAELWVKGAAIDWDILFTGRSARRVPLPTYPFEPKRCWIEGKNLLRAVDPVGYQSLKAQIHPLLDRNIPSLDGVRFTKQFSREDFYLADHRIREDCILPGVVYLEMVRAAVALAGGRSVDGLSSVIWIAPLVVGDSPCEASVRLKYDGKTVTFTVVTENQNEHIVHAQGKAELTGETPDGAKAITRLDLNALTSRCDRYISRSDLYRELEGRGLEYGSRMRGVEEVWTNGSETLARIVLPGDLHRTTEDFVLHPTLLDSALQIVATLMDSPDNGNRLFLPYAVEKITLTGSTPFRGYVYAVRCATENTRESRFNLDVTDEEGYPRVLLRGLMVRSMDSPEFRLGKPVDDLLYYEPCWETHPLEDNSISVIGQTVIFTSDRTRFKKMARVLTDAGEVKPVWLKPGKIYHQVSANIFEFNPTRKEDYNAFFGQMVHGGNFPKRILILSEDTVSFGKISEISRDDDIREMASGVGQAVRILFLLGKSLIEYRPKEEIRIVYLYEGQVEQPHLTAIAGFARSLKLENPRLKCRLVWVKGLPERYRSPHDLTIRELCNGEEEEVLYTTEGRFTRVFKVLDFTDTGEPALRSGGVYLITGGAGALGLIFARHLVTRVKASLVLLGRSPLTPDREAAIRELEEAGGKVLYLQVDVSDSAAVVKAVQRAVYHFGTINGIIHSAGVIGDAFVINKDQDTFDQVWNVKVRGALALDYATRDLRLDFFILFSSTASVMGNIGQSDYAAANRFLDVFAEIRQGWMRSGQRSGNSISINWPLWRDGGMRITSDLEGMILRSAGLRPLKTTPALRAFERALAIGRSQLVIVSGDRERIEQRLGASTGMAAFVAEYAEAAPGLEIAEKVTLSTNVNLIEMVTAFLTKAIEEILGIPNSEVDQEVSLQDLGANSVSMSRLVNKIETEWPLELPLPVLFDYPSVKALASYLVDKHENTLGKYLVASVPCINIASSNKVKPVQTEASDDSQKQQSGQEPIAIIGMAGMIGGTPNLGAFWKEIQKGRTLIREIPEERWRLWGGAEAVKEFEKQLYCRWGSFISEVDGFDARFFQISPREAEVMDPQIRLFLQCLYAAGEDGAVIRRLRGSNTGIYVGTCFHDYENELIRRKITVGPHDGTGCATTMLANRVSFYLDLKGPSLTIDTACSSSLVALHLASHALRRGDCEMAFVGGVNLILSPRHYLYFCEMGALSPSGRCHSFDERADGYVPGESVAAVLLKPLSQAIRNGDRIYAVIEGSAISHGGHTSSLTAPSPREQARVIAETWRGAGIDPATIDYVEAHGTGTRLGDPIEVEGLTVAFRQFTDKEAFCALGTTKAYIGHTEAASGITGLIRTVLSMQAEEIPVIPDFQRINSHIKLKGGPLYINRKPQPWPKRLDRPRRAVVSSFGFGGTNAHLVLGDGPLVPEDTHKPLPPYVFPLSAKTPDQLEALAFRLIKQLLELRHIAPVRVAFTLQAGREEMDYRLAVVAESFEELTRRLEAFLLKNDEDQVGNVFRGRKEAPAPGADLSDPWTQAKSWVAGAVVRWPMQDVMPPSQMVTLPNYPFATDRYWFTDRNNDSTDVRPKVPADDSKLHYFTPVWERVNVTTAPTVGDGLLIFAPEGADPVLLRRELGAAAVVVPGPRFVRTGEGKFTLCPDQAGDYEELLSCLDASGMMISQALVIGDTGETVADLDKIINEEENGVGPILFLGLVRALTRRGGNGGSKVAINYTFRSRDGIFHMRNQSMSGIALSAAKEAPWLNFKIIQVEQDALNLISLARIGLIKDRQRSSVEEIRYTDGGYWVRQLSPLIINSEMGRVLPIQRGGVILITGGAGGLGLIVAQDLAKRVRARLVLTGRSPLDDGIRTRLAELAGFGGEAIYLQADVADEARMGAVVAYARNCFGPIEGVIHVAGVIGHPMGLAEIDPEEIERISAAKVNGVRILDRVTQNEPLHFFLLFSSLSAIIGTAKLAAYAAANRFLDAFAEARERLQTGGHRYGRTVSINWPYWRDGGMRMSAEREAVIVETTGIESLPTVEGIEAIWRSLAYAESHNLAQVVVGHGERRRVEQTLIHNVVSDLTYVESLVQATSTDFSLLTNLLDDLSRMIIPLLRLRTERIKPDEDLADMGFESITITEFVEAVNRRFSLSLKPASFYEHRTLRSFAASLVSESAQQIRAAYSERSVIHLPKEDATTSGGVCKIESAAVCEQTEVNIQSEAAQVQEIAIVGISGIFPGSPDLMSFWLNIEAGRDLISDMPAERFHWETAAAADKEIAACRGGFIKDVDMFDPLFFGISPYEAEMMDPQQRLFIQAVWRAIEDAGYRGSDFAGRSIGVFVGVSNVDYSDLLTAENRDTVAHAVTGLSHAMLANRISYLFDLRGPSEPVDTGCSSSLVAVHRAVRAIRSGECEAAIVGGVNLLISPNPFIACTRAGMLSPDGRCSTFDHRANGYVRGEGVGAMLIKPFARAIDDGDHIYGVIRGTAVNHGGHALQGLTVPNPTAQAACLIAAYRDAGIDPLTITYIEAHGTGTALGDPIEINGLKKAFGHFMSAPGADAGYCAVGTVKTNIGHLEAAAGIAGMIKVLLAMKHQRIPASLHVEEVNPQIEIENSPFYIISQTQEWIPPTGPNGRPIPRRAGVSAFGFGGVNAHVVLEEYPSIPQDGGRSREVPQIIPLSAKNGDQLREAAALLSQRLKEWVAEGDVPALGDIAFTLQVGREPMDYRLAIVTQSVDEAVCILNSYFEQGEQTKGIVTGFCGRSNAVAAVVGESEEGRFFLENLATRGRLQDIARLWVDGVEIPWAIFHQGEQRSRVSLPTYPFARRRCWVNSPPQVPLVTITRTEVEGEFFQFEEGIRHLEELGRSLLIGVLQEIGVFTKAGESYVEDDLWVHLGVIPIYNRFFTALISMLVRAGYLRREVNRIITTSRVETATAEAAVQRETVQTVFSKVAGHLTLMERCLNALLKVLRGEQDGLNVLFPAGDTMLVETVYKDNDLANYYNRVVADSVKDIVKSQVNAGDFKIRILEVCAGAGGASEFVLKRLREFGNKIEYYYTDITSSLVEYGSQQFNGCIPNLVFKALDIEDDPREQGLDPLSFDIIMATNVIHATRDILHTLSNIYLLLRQGGFLVVNELTRERDLATLTFGLTKGWWYFTDDDRMRANSPLLETEGWRRRIEEAGFGSVKVVGLPGLTDKEKEQAVIICEKRVNQFSQHESNFERTIPEKIIAEKEDEVMPVSGTVKLNLDLVPWIREYVIGIFAEMLRLQWEEIDPHATFDIFGVDSLTGIQIVQRMECDLGSLPKTLLLEYGSIDKIAHFLSDEHCEACKILMKKKGKKPVILPEQNGLNILQRPVLAESSTEESYGEDIAIIGMGGIFPGSRTLDEFWQNLKACRDLIREIPPDRFDWRPIFGDPRQESCRTNCRWGGFLDEIDTFDPRFFKITPAEAELMDPQQRLFLQVVWQAIEDAGYRASCLTGNNTGVFVGVSAFDYNEVLQRCGRQYDAYVPSGLSHAILANRVSFLLDLRGPSEPVDTACSSSLVAIHRAIRAIQSGDCDTAIAGGVNVLLTSQLYIAFAQAGFLSPDGRCKPFDRQANGYVRGEGAGAVLLKRVSCALADGDHIYAVIKGSGVNHGGRVQSLTVPNAQAQAALIRNVYTRAGVDPATVTYIESHGTGTALGDPLEINGLKKAFEEALTRKFGQSHCHYCGVGSVKSNIGHLESAAGIAGLIKVLLAIKHHIIPGMVHFRELNPYIDLDNTPFYITAETKSWETLVDERGYPLPRRAGISSFGFGGVNAHLLVEEFLPPAEKAISSGDDDSKREVVVLSARDEALLREYVVRLINWLQDYDNKGLYSLANIAYTLQVGREQLSTRVAFCVRNLSELVGRCQDFLARKAGTEGIITGIVADRNRKRANSDEIRELINTGCHEEVAKIWAGVANIDWACVSTGQQRSRVPLPTYPFARERYWPESSQGGEEPVDAEENLTKLLYQLQHGERSIEEVAQTLGESMASVEIEEQGGNR